MKTVMKSFPVLIGTLLLNGCCCVDWCEPKPKPCCVRDCNDVRQKCCPKPHFWNDCRCDPSNYDLN